MKQTHNMNQRGIAPLAVIALLVAILLAGFIFLRIQDNQSSSQQSNPESTPGVQDNLPNNQSEADTLNAQDQNTNTAPSDNQPPEVHIDVTPSSGVTPSTDQPKNNPKIPCPQSGCGNAI